MPRRRSPRALPSRLRALLPGLPRAPKRPKRPSLPRLPLPARSRPPEGRDPARRAPPRRGRCAGSAARTRVRPGAAPTTCTSRPGCAGGPSLRWCSCCTGAARRPRSSPTPPASRPRPTATASCSCCPTSSRRHHPQRCWRWYEAAHQHRDAGEPAVLAGIVAQVGAEQDRWRVDPRRVYVAGLSAGGAMALTLAATYPDVFAAAGVASAPAYRSANGAGQALGAMAGRTAVPPPGPGSPRSRRRSWCRAARTASCAP